MTCRTCPQSLTAADVKRGCRRCCACRQVAPGPHGGPRQPRTVRRSASEAPSVPWWATAPREGLTAAAEARLAQGLLVNKTDRQFSLMPKGWGDYAK